MDTHNVKSANICKIYAIYKKKSMCPWTIFHNYVKLRQITGRQTRGYGLIPRHTPCRSPEAAPWQSGVKHQTYPELTLNMGVAPDFSSTGQYRPIGTGRLCTCAHGPSLAQKRVVDELRWEVQSNMTMMNMWGFPKIVVSPKSSTLKGFSLINHP